MTGGGTQAPVLGVQRLRRRTAGEVPLSGVISESLSAERDLGSPSATVVHEGQLQGLDPGQEASGSSLLWKQRSSTVGSGPEADNTLGNWP